MRTPSGQSVYAVPEAGAPGQLPVAAPEEEAFDEVLTTRLSRWIQDLLVSVDQAYNQLVLRTPAGAAQLLASADGTHVRFWVASLVTTQFWLSPPKMR